MKTIYVQCRRTCPKLALIMCVVLANCIETFLSEGLQTNCPENYFIVSNLIGISLVAILCFMIVLHAHFVQGFVKLMPCIQCTCHLVKL